MASTNPRGDVIVSDPPFVVDLFNNTRWSWLWLLIRLYLGYTWLTSGLGKISNPAWMQTGEALRGFWTNAIAVPEAPARPAIAFDWYRSFLQTMLAANTYTWFAKVIVIGEIVIGIALILGAFVGIAAFLGAFLNWNFMMAGTASINPLMFVITILLILAWKTAGWIGLDRWLLPALGTPWSRGRVFQGDRVRPEAMPVTGPTREDELAARSTRLERDGDSDDDLIVEDDRGR